VPFWKEEQFREKKFNYFGLFEQALCGIKYIRDPHSTRPETADLRKYHNVSVAANNISVLCLCFMITQLLKEYEYSIQEVAVKNADGLAKAHLYIHDKKNNTLLLFKDIEECPLWKSNEKEPQEVQSIMDDCGAKTCKYIYFAMDNAYLQIIGHNNDADDPGRGYNAYSLKWFFEEYFGVEEYGRFSKELELYVESVRNCIGYNTVNYSSQDKFQLHLIPS
jgi:hypothetical protein